MDDRLELIDAAIYADAFDSAVTADELWRYSRRAVGREELRRHLDEDPVLRSVLSGRDGLYCLVGREALLEASPRGRRRALNLRRRARLVARALRHAPFVRGLVLTGSAAAGDAGDDADVDLLVIVAAGRMSFVFVVLGSLARLLSRRLFCPNQYLSVDHLEVGPRDFYVAREIAQARPLAGRGEDFLAANEWTAELLPNSEPRASGVPALPGGAALQSLVEWPLRGRIGDAADRALRRVALARLGVHHRERGSEAPLNAVAALEAGVELRFHGTPVHQRTLARYEEQRAEIASRLRSRQRPDAALTPAGGRVTGR